MQGNGALGNAQAGAALERREFVIRDFRTESGVVLPEARVVYSTLGKLNASERERLTFGVPRRDRPVLASFARLQELAALDPRSGPVPPALADLAATELLDLASGPAAPITPPGERPA